MDDYDLMPHIAHAPLWRRRLAAFIDHPRMQIAIIVVIIVNALILGLEAIPAAMDAWGPLLKVLDKICLAIFVVELAIKFIAYRFHMLRSGWNVFDVLVVAIALVPASGPLAVLRSLRVLRVFRLITAIPALKRVVAAFLHAIPGLGAVGILLLIIMFVAAVMATGFFADTHPQWFGSLGQSMFTLFQIMTLESWSMGIVRPVMEVHPMAWLFFVPFIIVATFAMLNLFIGVIVSTIQELDTVHKGNPEPMGAVAQASEVRPSTPDAEELCARLEADLAALRALLQAKQTPPSPSSSQE